MVIYLRDQDDEGKQDNETQIYNFALRVLAEQGGTPEGRSVHTEPYDVKDHTGNNQGDADFNVGSIEVIQ